jgi:hypothetical protein
MLKVVPAEKWHVEEIRVQPRHRDVHRRIVELIDHLPLDGALTLLSDGVPVAVGGIYKGLGWTLLAEDLRRGEMIVIHRVASRMLRCYNDVVLAEIDEKHDEAVRWARMLGFAKIVEGENLSWYAYTIL